MLSWFRLRIGNQEIGGLVDNELKDSDSIFLVNVVSSSHPDFHGTESSHFLLDWPRITVKGLKHAQLNLIPNILPVPAQILDIFISILWSSSSECWTGHEIQNDLRVLINLRKGSKDHDQRPKNQESKDANAGRQGPIHPNTTVRTEDRDGDDDDFGPWNEDVTVIIQEMLGHDPDGSVQANQVTGFRVPNFLPLGFRVFKSSSMNFDERSK